MSDMMKRIFYTAFQNWTMPESTVHEHPLSMALSLVMNVKFLVTGLFYDLQEI